MAPPNSALCFGALGNILFAEMDEPQIQGDEGIEELRLFPLNVALFPGMTLALRIFEDRYKLMIGECLDDNAPFGVVQIREGVEAGGPAEPYRIGTTARITQVERLEEGRMNLATIGENRFSIMDTDHELLYLKGKVKYLPEEMGEIGEEELDQARKLFGEYVRGLAGLRGAWMRQARIPNDNGLLSYSIAQYLDLPSKAKQRLLELPFIGERLRYEIPLLEGATQRIRDQLAKRSPYKGPRLN